MPEQGIAVKVQWYRWGSEGREYAGTDDKPVVLPVPGTLVWGRGPSYPGEHAIPVSPPMSIERLGLPGTTRKDLMRELLVISAHTGAPLEPRHRGSTQVEVSSSNGVLCHLSRVRLVRTRTAAPAGFDYATASGVPLVLRENGLLLLEHREHRHADWQTIAEITISKMLPPLVTPPSYVNTRTRRVEREMDASERALAAYLDDAAQTMDKPACVLALLAAREDTKDMEKWVGAAMARLGHPFAKDDLCADRLVEAVRRAATPPGEDDELDVRTYLLTGAHVRRGSRTMADAVKVARMLADKDLIPPDLLAEARSGFGVEAEVGVEGS